MQADIEASPSFSFATITIPPGGELQVEAGAMAAWTGGVEIETDTRGGLMSGLKRSVLGGESFFINTFTAPEGGTVSVAAALPGDLVTTTLDGSKTLYVQSGSWLASDAGIEVDTKWGGGKTFFSGEGLFMLKCTGQGDILVSSYGAILSRDLGPGETLVLDTGHVVAFEETISYEVRKAGGWKTTILGGEGIVTHYTGPGKLWLQTRSPQGLVNWLIPRLPFSRD